MLPAVAVSWKAQSGTGDMEGDRGLSAETVWESGTVLMCMPPIYRKSHQKEVRWKTLFYWELAVMQKV